MLERLLLEGEMISPVLGFEGYYITSFGRVISAKKKYKQKTLEGEIYEATIYKILKPFNTGGYDRVTLIKDGKKNNVYVHELVMVNFVGMTDKVKMKIKHLDGDKTNNKLGNLVYAPRKKPLL